MPRASTQKREHSMRSTMYSHTSTEYVSAIRPDIVKDMPKCP